MWCIIWIHLKFRYAIIHKYRENVLVRNSGSNLSSDISKLHFLKLLQKTLRCHFGPFMDKKSASKYTCDTCRYHFFSSTIGWRWSSITLVWHERYSWNTGITKFNNAIDRCIWHVFKLFQRGCTHEIYQY